MATLRQNMATKEWVIIATERAQRPEQFISTSRPLTEELTPLDPRCPFCPGNEEGPEFEVWRIPASGPWQIRLLRNRYPAVSPQGGAQREFQGVYRSIAAVGYHEIIVESPLHNTTTALQPPDEVTQTLLTMWRRGHEISQDARIEHVLYFKNHGPTAGASIIHPHAQIIGLPIVPQSTRGRMEEARRYHDDTGRCVFCHMLAEELTAQVRVVDENEHCVAFVPYAASTPFHTWIMPRQHNATFLNASTETIQGMGALLHTVLRKLYHGLRDPDYNYMIRNTPLREPGRDYMHWYLTIVPRLSRSAGFELGSGMRINVMLPEVCAAFLRDTRIDL